MVVFLPWPFYRRLSHTLQAHLCEAVFHNLSYIVNHAIEQPLDIYFDLTSKSKTIHPLVCPYVGKDRLSDGYSPGIDLTPLLGIDLAGHFPRKVGKLNGNGIP